MWYTILIMLAIDIGGLLFIYAVLSDRVKRVTTASSQVATLRDEVSRLVVELNQTTDRNIALIEDRISSLNELLSAADKKIGLLRREIEKHDVGTQVYTRLAETKAAAPAPEPAKAPPPAPVPAAPPQGLAVELSEKTVERAELRERVMMLHRAGFSPALIAGRVGAPLGEIELIISLEQRKGQA